MVKKMKSLWALLFIVTSGIAFVSCSKEVINDVSSTSASDGSGSVAVGDDGSTLVLCTRTVDDDALVAYPAFVYVFNASEECVGTAVLESAESTIDIELGEGTYMVSAVAGATPADYDIPTEDDVTITSVVGLKAGKTHGDLLFAQSTVSLGAGEVKMHVLSLERKVMFLQEVTINDVPSRMTDVSVTISPLYEGLCLDGSYSGANGSYTVHLDKQEGTNVWTKSPDVYLLEAAEGATVKVQMTDDEGTKSYAYSLANELQANYKIRIKGTYTAQAGITLSGQIAGVAWEGERTITFDFDEDGSTGGSEEQGGSTTTDAVPTVGTMYKGCYVLTVKPQSNNTTAVTLMSPTQTYGLNFTEGDQASIKTAVDAGIKEIAVAGISGWRLPDYSEISKVLGNSTAINKALEGAGITGNNVNPSVSFFYKTSDGTIDAYCRNAAVEFDAKTRLRAFTTLTFK